MNISLIFSNLIKNNQTNFSFSYNFMVSILFKDDYGLANDLLVDNYDWINQS